jgi:hypothetical protein
MRDQTVEKRYGACAEDMIIHVCETGRGMCEDSMERLLRVSTIQSSNYVTHVDDEHVPHSLRLRQVSH